MKTIYFHIGTHKTGSTALQSFLLNNTQALIENNFIYDELIENGINHMDLSHSPNKWKNFHPNTNFNYIFSSEDFYFSFFEKKNEPKILEHLKKNPQRFKNHEIKIIIYIKRQDLFSQSLNNEIIKRHGSIKNYCYNVVPLNYYDHLKKIKDYSGVEERWNGRLTTDTACATRSLRSFQPDPAHTS